jgi:peptide/nickel transport system substrate-binding protein
MKDYDERMQPTRRDVLALAALGLVAAPSSALAAVPEGQLTWGIHVSLAPSWFDPAETQALITRCSTHSMTLW